MAPVFGYWNLRGYGQYVRLMMAYVGAEYEDKRYALKQIKDDEYDRSEWMNDKFNLGLDFPNLPYYIDGDVKLSQSFAIVKYLGRKHDLAPTTEEEKIRVDMIEAEALDMRFKWSSTCYGPTFEKDKPQFLITVNQKLKELSAYLGSHDFFAGQKLTYVDFIMFELLDQHTVMEPKLLADFPNLQAFMERFRGLKNIEAYMKSDKYLAYPLNGPMAFFGGK